MSQDTRQNAAFCEWWATLDEETREDAINTGAYHLARQAWKQSARHQNLTRALRRVHSDMYKQA